MHHIDDAWMLTTEERLSYAVECASCTIGDPVLLYATSASGQHCTPAGTQPLITTQPPQAACPTLTATSLMLSYTSATISLSRPWLKNRSDRLRSRRRYICRVAATSSTASTKWLYVPGAPTGLGAPVRALSGASQPWGGGQVVTLGDWRVMYFCWARRRPSRFFTAGPAGRTGVVGLSGVWNDW